VIEAVNLSKTFQDKKRGEVKAVDEVSFVCRPGEIYGLLGANGAGKTTTLRMLATILEPTDGTARLCGHDIVEHPERVRQHCGFLSTATALYPRLTAQEMVEYFGRLNGLDEATLKKRIDQIFQRLDMNSFRDRAATSFLRHEAENLHRPDPGARSTSYDLRRAGRWGWTS
jgi:sodium transport system ATP-binding protein